MNKKSINPLSFAAIAYCLSTRLAFADTLGGNMFSGIIEALSYYLFCVMSVIFGLIILALHIANKGKLLRAILSLFLIIPVAVTALCGRSINPFTVQFSGAGYEFNQIKIFVYLNATLWLAVSVIRTRNLYLRCISGLIAIIIGATSAYYIVEDYNRKAFLSAKHEIIMLVRNSTKSSRSAQALIEKYPQMLEDKGLLKIIVEYSCRTKRHELVQYLILHGATPTISDFVYLGDKEGVHKAIQKYPPHLRRYAVCIAEQTAVAISNREMFESLKEFFVLYYDTNGDVRSIYEDIPSPDGSPVWETPLTCAIHYKNMEWVKLVVDHHNINYRQQPALIVAAGSKKRIEKLLYLLNAGAEPNIQDSHYGESPMHFAAKSGNLDAIKALISYGAAINVRTKYGDTPLHYAVKGGKIDAIHFLLKAGADRTIKNRQNLSPEESIDKHQTFGDSKKKIIHQAFMNYMDSHSISKDK